MDVIAALQDEATKLKKQLDAVLHAIHLLGKNGKGTAKTHVKSPTHERRWKSEDRRCTEEALGEGSGIEKESRLILAEIIRPPVS